MANQSINSRWIEDKQLDKRNNTELTEKKRIDLENKIILDGQ